MNWLRLLLSTFTLSHAYTPNIFLHIIFFGLIFAILMTMNSMYEIVASIYFDKKRMELHEEIVQCLRAEERDTLRWNRNRVKAAETAKSASHSKIMTETAKPLSLDTKTAVQLTAQTPQAAKKDRSKGRSENVAKSKKKG